ncbi:hypothetical protein BC828DRAFT_380733 [Blastocladiella britannica]|nr:hypothetical protein BC828DRAFT_380733 [Blastocladiella britannica]
MLFKTPSGGRRALRTLTAQFLGRFIQQKGDEGHDSLEDAIAPLDILRKKIANPSLRM